MIGWLVNDYLCTIEGTKTLWHDLLDWLPGLEWRGGMPFSDLKRHVEVQAAIEGKPDYIIRNGTFFPPLDIDCPTISLIQDIYEDKGPQMEVARKSTLTVFNSEYTQSKYRDIANHVIIPIAIDFNLFRILPAREVLRRKWGIPERCVLWVGANNEYKGWDVLGRVVRETDLNFCIVRKDIDHPEFRKNWCPPRSTVCWNVPHRDLVEIINVCELGLCTSHMETQHLAGLEMGACGLPLVTTDVGAYFSRTDGVWGTKAKDPAELPSLVEVMMTATNGATRERIRDYWMGQGFRRESVAHRWRQVVEAVT